MSLPAEVCPTKDLLTEQMGTSTRDAESVTEEKRESSGSDVSDLEDLSVQNKTFKPHRDVTCTSQETDSNADSRSESSSLSRSTIDANEIRNRVKKSVDRKQRAVRRRKRGEAAAVNRARRENRDTVKQGSSAWDDGW